MTKQVSRDHADAYCQELKYSKPNMRFVEGHIEYLDQAGIADQSVNIIISNCVVNLSPDKRRVLQEAYRVLAKGGEFYFSDVYCNRRLPQHVKDNQVGFVACSMLDMHDNLHHLPHVCYYWSLPMRCQCVMFQVLCVANF